MNVINLLDEYTIVAHEQKKTNIHYIKKNLQLKFSQS